eukprot:g28124.t1
MPMVIDQKEHIVFAEDGSLTVEQLTTRSGNVAEALRRVQSHFVAVCLPRGPGLIVALLGVWRAKKAYVPLEPSFPLQRIRFILEDSEASVVITERGSEPPASLEWPRLRLQWPSGEPEMDEEPAPAPAVEQVTHLAYLIYTSGSTGTPKGQMILWFVGVLVPHSAVANVLNAFESLRKEKSTEDVLLSVTTFCFDISVLEMFWPLCYGFSLHLASAAESRSGALLRQRLEELSRRAAARGGQVIFQATPSSFRGLLNAGWQGVHNNVFAICGGEAFPDALLEPLSLRCDQLWNAYGPTETTIWSAAFDVSSAGALSSLRPVPIGTPIAGGSSQ